MKLNVTLFIFFISSSCYSQFLEPGLSVGLNNYSGDLKRGYSITDVSLGFEIFNRFNISSHQTFKISYKRGGLKSKDRINDNLSSNRNMWFKSKFSELSLKFEYNFLDYFDEINKENFTPYLFMGIGSTLIQNTFDRDTPVGKNKKLIINIPFGVGFKYLINKQFSLALEFEVKKTFNDNLDLTLTDGGTILQIIKENQLRPFRKLDLERVAKEVISWDLNNGILDIELSIDGNNGNIRKH